VSNLTKKIGDKEILKGTSFSIAPNSIVGLMAPNGAGKTTLLKILAGLTKKTSGEIIIGNAPLSESSKSEVSFMPDANMLYSWFDVKDAVKFYKTFYPDFDTERCSELLSFMELNTQDSIKKLSKGTLERLMLALTLSRRAKFYILDEPFGGIDPIAKSKIIDSILDHFPAEGSSLIFSTHLIKDVEKILSHVLFLKDGVIGLQGDCEELRGTYNKTIEELYMEVFGNA